jgi:hypothetical protein
MKDTLIKSESGLNKEEISLLRERFITKYCKEKGWDQQTLTTEQLLEISQNREYKNPGLILG